MSEKETLPCQALEEAEAESGHLHGHIHAQMHSHYHGQIHQQICEHHGGQNHENASGLIVTIRSHSGLSGDMLLTGFATLNMERQGLTPGTPQADAWLGDILAKIMPDLKDSVKIVTRSVAGIQGLQAKVSLPEAHEHRNLADIREILAKTAISGYAREKASQCFDALATCEASVHGAKPEEIHFHEIGALDSILDICAVCELYSMLAPFRLVCSPLPIADGKVECAHGNLPAPAPATLRLLAGMTVTGFAGDTLAGETVTPTAAALLRVLKASFGRWPTFTIRHTALVYGQREFANAPNGVIFALGQANGNI